MIARGSIGLALLLGLACRSSVAAPPSEGTPKQPDPKPMEQKKSRDVQLELIEGHGLAGVYHGGVAVADFDSDGRPDVVLTGYFKAGRPALNCLDGVAIRVFHNVTVKGQSIRFEKSVEYPDLGQCASDIVTGDFNGDKKPDFAVAIKNGVDTTVYFGKGGMRFDPVVVEKNFGTHSVSFGMAAADIDKDGKDDLIFNSASDPSYYGAGAGLWYRWTGKKFAPMQEDFPHAISYGGTLAAGDLDGDGYPEIAVAGNSSTPFGKHYCKNLLYGQIHKNERGRIAQEPWEIVNAFALKRAGRADASVPPNPKRLEISCNGGDNVQYLMADIDKDGTKDIIVAGSSGFGGRADLSGNTHYSFAILRNVGGTGRDFVTWENVGMGSDGRPGDRNGDATNSGVGNVDQQGIAVGDLDGDGWPEIFIEGHRRGDIDGSRYIFGNMLFWNEHDGQFRWLPDALPIPHPLGESGAAIADFDGDGRGELLVTGAERPFHSNGNNPQDTNTAETIKAYLLRLPR